MILDLQRIKVLPKAFISSMQNLIECESGKRSCFYDVLFPYTTRIQKKRKDLSTSKQFKGYHDQKEKDHYFYFKAFGHRHPFLRIQKMEMLIF